ncbi:MAG TPA: DUF2029 domain-containing protein, partial [Aliiroseovarius sp.]|nr:DUF2029 domain-containing protein [Aliiroseovarius sp.]
MKPAEFLKDHAIAYFALVAALLGAALFGPIAPSRDLLALWLAGEAVANGLPEQIYPPAAELFIMQPPEGWYLHAAEMGWAGEVFPFIYPPIWAWVMAPVTELFSFQGFSRFMFGVNTAALIGLIGAAARLAFPASAGHRPRWLFWLPVALLVYYFSRAGLVSLFQGQPQIVVAFLTVYALERVQAGHPLRGWVAMGLAIALKLSPLPLLVLWLAVGERRAALTALVFASALGLLSLVLAGWPIHARF